MDIGYLTEIFSDINPFDLNFIFLLLFIPLSFFLIFSFGIVLLHWVTKKIRSRENLYEIIKEYSFNEAFFISIGILMLYYIFTYILMFFIMKSLNNDLIAYLLFIFFAIIAMGYLKTICQIQYERSIKCAKKLSLSLVCLIVGFSFVSIIFKIDAGVMLISLFLAIYTGPLLVAPSKPSKKKKATNYRIFLGSIFITFIVFQYINKNIWNEEIISKTNSLSNLSFNLIFNKALLLENKTDVEINLPYKYYVKEIDNYCQNNLFIYNEKNESICTIIKDKKENRQKDTSFLINYFGDSTIKYTIGKEYWYLNVSRHIRLYFTNVVTKNVGENNDFKVIGFIMFLIKEKQFSNKIGSEKILLSTSSVLFEKKE